VEKEKEALRMELSKAKAQISEADAAISSQKAQLEKLNHVVAEADAERVRQKKELDLVLSERWGRNGWHLVPYMFLLLLLLLLFAA
jgi:uncharacterized coiled-coil protein SlyX